MWKTLSNSAAVIQETMYQISPESPELYRTYYKKWSLFPDTLYNSIKFMSAQYSAHKSFCGCPLAVLYVDLIKLNISHGVNGQAGQTAL